MNWLKHLFGSKENNSASIAKERLQIIVAHQRNSIEKPDFIHKLQQEITAVIAKYVNIDKDQVLVDFDQQGDRSVLELNITIPDSIPQKVKSA